MRRRLHKNQTNRSPDTDTMLPEIPFTPRPAQTAILSYESGYMGVSAVPGSGKTWTLSRLAAQIIRKGILADDQEVLVVTLVNSAVDNFYDRVSGFVRDMDLLPLMGYRVRTLHGLAHDIVRERPDLVGLSENFQIADEREINAMRAEIARSWLHSHPGALEGYLNPELDGDRLGWVLREKLPELVDETALAVIGYAKDQQLTPERLRERLDRIPLPLPLAEMGAEIYADYQRALLYRGSVDFDDLIRLALEALNLDASLLERLRGRWPYILEDEAQDSSRLQEEILKLLAGPGGNWVRVGDPNQAIYETFTTANPKYLRHFLTQPDVAARELPDSGRSTQSIINLANHLVDWTMNSHPNPEVRNALVAPPHIQPTPPGDPQPNPEDNPEGIYLYARKLSPQEEIHVVADSLQRWLPEHSDWTVAVLVPRNVRGTELVDELRRRNIEVVDSLLRSTSATRKTAGALGNLLRYLSDPSSPSKLAAAYQVWESRRGEGSPAEQDSGGTTSGDRIQKAANHNAELLRKLGRVEDYLWPRPGQDWLEQSGLSESDPEASERLDSFRSSIQTWQGAALLPVDQVLLTLAQDLFTRPAELALAHKLAVLLRRASESNPTWRLPELSEELAVIARNERRFIGFSSDDTGFDPQRYAGKVVVATIHKAKGLEWDRVYLLSANNYDFPSGAAEDTFISERWFLRSQLNLQVEALAQLEAVLHGDDYNWYQEGEASLQARQDYVRERLRLLYVGMTRARKELVVTWNSGRRGEAKPAAALQELMDFWSKRRISGASDEPLP